jgi:hypothetical protein
LSAETTRRRPSGRARGTRAGAILLCALVWATLCASPSWAAGSHGGGARLVVKMSGLPRGAPGKAVVRGPHGFDRTISRSETFAGLPPGAYSVTTVPVILHRAYKEIPAESKALPVRRHLHVHLRRAGKAVAEVAYGTIRSSSVRTLGSQILAVVGNPESPQGVVVSKDSAAGIVVGSILARTPDAMLPHGLFDRVTATRDRHGEVVLSFAPASLWEAFPALDLETTVPLAESVLPEGAARASDLSSIDLGLGRDLFQKKLAASCGASPSGWSLAPSGSIQPSLRVEIHRHYLVVPYGELSLELKGSLGLDATIPKGVHCGFTVSGPGVDGVVPVAGVPVPVEGGVDFSVSIQSAGPIQVNANLGVDATGGMTFDGAKVKPIVDFKPKASGSVVGSGGEVDLGPDFEVGIGALDGNAHVGVTPGLAAKGTSGGCELDLKGSVGAGIDAAGWHPSINSPSVTKALYKCPTPPSGGGQKPSGGGVNTPGGGSSSGTWTIQSVPAPAAQYSSLWGVSCPTAGFCMAVGTSEAEGLIERLGPGRWSIEPGATVPGAQSVALYEVSCVSPTSCTAVGGQGTGSGEQPLVEHWNGVQWTYQPGPSVSVPYTRLLSISCADESWCMAVGEADYGDGESTEIAEHWDGSSWTVESLPSPEGSDARALSGVDCVGRGFCAAVGGYDNDEGTFTGHAYGDTWNGTGWTLGTVVGPPANEYSGLAGVDCVSSAYCAAVGYWDAGLGTDAQPMAVGWSGASWTDQPLPSLGSPELGGETPGVFCSSSTACITVGRYADEAGGGVLAERWDGASWTSMATPPVPGALFADLNDVFCVTATSCVAVGDSLATATGPGQPLVETYSGP